MQQPVDAAGSQSQMGDISAGPQYARHMMVMVCHPHAVDKRPHCQIGVWHVINNTSQTLVKCYRVCDHDRMKKVRSCDAVGPGRDKTDVEAATAGAPCSHAQYMVH